MKAQLLIKPFDKYLILEPDKIMISGGFASEPNSLLASYFDHIFPFSPGVGRCSSQSGSERESDESPRVAEPSAPVPIPDSEDLQRRKEEARRKRRRKKRSGSSVVTSCFQGN